MKKTIASVLVMMVMSVSAFSAQGNGVITAGGMNDYANLTIKGEAAKVIFDAMNDVPVTSKRDGSLMTTIKLGKEITCTQTAAFAINYTCRMSIDSSGGANRNFQR